MECTFKPSASGPNEYPRIVDEISPGQPPRFLGQPEGPLEAVAGHPKRSFAEPPREDVHRASHAYENCAIEGGGVAAHPDLLFGSAQTDEDDRGSGGH